MQCADGESASQRERFDTRWSEAEFWDACARLAQAIVAKGLASFSRFAMWDPATVVSDGRHARSTISCVSTMPVADGCVQCTDDESANFPRRKCMTWPEDSWATQNADWGASGNSDGGRSCADSEASETLKTQVTDDCMQCADDESASQRERCDTPWSEAEFWERCDTPWSE